MTTTTEHAPEATHAKRPNALIRLYRGETSFDFVGRRRWWYLISGTIILAGLISLGVRGLNLGIDFKGGTEWTVPAKTLSVTSATNAVKAVGITPSVVESLGTGSSRSIEVEADLSHLSASAQTTDKTAIAAALAKAAHTTVAQESIDDVGATWGGTVTDKAIEAMVVFFILVTIYIAIRFQWRMALAALMKVILHDLLITVGIFSLTWFQVTPNGVIAVLTIMGYSLYDTVVVFDKINENTKGLGATRRFNYPQMVNLSLNQVLARSVNTSLVAVLPVLSVLVIGAQLLGADTLRQFGFPLVIGLIAGAYSSIFIAAPLPGGMRAAREAVRSGTASRRGDGLLTPRAAAELLAGPGSAPGRPGRAGAGRGRSQGQLIRPGTAAARRAPAARRGATTAVADTDEEELAGTRTAAGPNGAGTRVSAELPANWAEMTDEEKQAWALDFADRAARGGGQARQASGAAGARQPGTGASGPRRPPRPRKGGGRGGRRR